MEEREKVIKLYDIYKNLFTDKQCECFQFYYFEDLSLNEISENLGVSKSFVGKTLNKVVSKLYEYDNLLSIYDIYKKLEKIKDNTKDSETKKELENLIEG